MSTPTSSQTEAKNGFAPWMTFSARAASRTMPNVHADSATMPADATTQTETQNAEEWVNDCLFECYND